MMKKVVDSLELAIVSGEIDHAIDFLAQLDEVDLSDDGCLNSELFSEALRLLDVSSHHGDVAWHVFVWIVGKCSAMSELQLEALRDYVASSYKVFESDLLVSEAAEWIGWFRDVRSLGIIGAWLESWPELSESGRRGVRTSIAEFLDGNELGKGQRELAEKLADQYENLMRTERLRKTSLH